MTWIEASWNTIQNTWLITSWIYLSWNVESWQSRITWLGNAEFKHECTWNSIQASSVLWVSESSWKQMTSFFMQSSNISGFIWYAMLGILCFIVIHYVIKYLNVILQNINFLIKNNNTTLDNNNKVLTSLSKVNDMVLEMYVNSKSNSDDLVKSLILIAIEVWKMNKKVQKIKEQVDDNTIRWFEFSIDKSFSTLDKHWIKLIDYAGQKYLEWMNWVDIISVEKNDNIDTSIISETIEPWIELYENIVKKSKVIILSQ